MKYIKLFEDINLDQKDINLDNQDLLDIKDVFQEYADKWNLSYHEYDGIRHSNKTPMDTYQIFINEYSKGKYPKERTDNSDEICIFGLINENEKGHLNEIQSDVYEFCDRLRDIGYSVRGGYCNTAYKYEGSGINFNIDISSI